MAILTVLHYGDPLLREPTQEIPKASAKIQKLVADMFDTMYAHNGVGLAAPQVGVAKRLFVLDVSTEDQRFPRMVFINPVIVKKEGAIVSWEGCLSFPNVFIDVKRYAAITIRARDLKGRMFSLSPEPGSLLSRAIQHELDHLNGILFIDHLIDRFGTEEMLKQNGLPAIDPNRILAEPDIDQILHCSG